jgi:hypothetical protein
MEQHQQVGQLQRLSQQEQLARTQVVLAWQR